MKTYQRKRKSSSMKGAGASQKRRKARSFENQDRISELPSEVIHQIFSSLTTKSAARTSVLSRRWHQAWTSSPFLHFDQREYATVPGFISSVDRAIELCGEPDTKLERFMLSWREGFDMSKAVPWLRYAMSHNVKQILLDVPPGKEGRKLPSFLFHGVAKVRFYSPSSLSVV
ncbi:F-box/FBD/LRR-repeat protein At5g22700-like [Asparagus officinalis]|uniref:F-box/FBD/LRR-repeat protein At5g22700-like n=1 Tax=Asparagus officinalis TaxID=4686 RepID=UPI00098E80CF|nr:F-box/FBD/LRR-repeat protein At5g22700-like [Asparagus officinalis]